MYNTWFQTWIGNFPYGMVSLVINSLCPGVDAIDTREYMVSGMGGGALEKAIKLEREVS